jgi:hypothetical protein
MTFSIMTLGIKCHYAECRDYFYVMLTAAMLNFVSLIVVILDIIMLSVMLPNLIFVHTRTTKCR